MFDDAKTEAEKDFSFLAGSTGLQRDEFDWLGEALKCNWLPDSLLSGLGDQVRLVSGHREIEGRMYELFNRCQKELHVCTHQPYLLNEFSQIKQMSVGTKNPPYLPYLFLYTADDIVAKIGFQLSDILKIVDIKKTNFHGHFVIFDSHSALIFLNQDAASADKLLHVESSFAVDYLKKLLCK